jgi:hypothetical protein
MNYGVADALARGVCHGSVYKHHPACLDNKQKHEDGHDSHQAEFDQTLTAAAVRRGSPACH